MKLLRGQIRDYAWGSRHVIAQLQGRPVPSPGPEAELWLGDHCGAPATVLGSDAPLPELLAADPEHWLGRPVLDRFGARLPFLLKVLAADAPLSLQAHPDAEQARAGYAREQAAGTAPALRNYVDPHHKPELLVALTQMDALCGFQDPAIAAELFAAVDLPALAPLAAALRQGPAALRRCRCVRCSPGPTRSARRWSGPRCRRPGGGVEARRRPRRALPAMIRVCWSRCCSTM